MEGIRCTHRRLVFFSQGRDTAALWHGVVAIHSGSYWIINTLDMLIVNTKVMGEPDHESG
ncbi:hypothetical protein [Aneurinibacillus migulanus]|uniref:hypothetical protein n=1 Tax=Aneurinibacillus migulanus TaxID=47500 RepID=UPI001F3C437A|nr:hypothetical protein [Aneurinibacillus migulanus]